MFLTNYSVEIFSLNIKFLFTVSCWIIFQTMENKNRSHLIHLCSPGKNILTVRQNSTKKRYFQKLLPTRHTTSFQHLLDVYTTSATSYRRLIDVETMSCVYWVKHLLLIGFWVVRFIPRTQFLFQKKEKGNKYVIFKNKKCERSMNKQ